MHVKGLKNEWYANLLPHEKSVVWKWLSRITVALIAIIGFLLIIHFNIDFSY